MKITFNNNIILTAENNTISDIDILESPNSCAIKLASRGNYFYKYISLSKNKHNRKVLLTTLNNNTSINLVFNPDNTLLNGIIEIKGMQGSYIIAFQNNILEVIFKNKKDKISHLTTLGFVNNFNINELDKILEDIFPLIAINIKHNKYMGFDNIYFNISSIITYMEQCLHISNALSPSLAEKTFVIYNNLNLNSENTPKRSI